MPSQSTNRNHDITYYTVLGLPTLENGKPGPLRQEELKTAYHRALLLHHPDKIRERDENNISSPNSRRNNTQYTVDQIVRAYQVLADSKLKSEYDAQLVLKDAFPNPSAESVTFQKGPHLGIEAYDLDDLTYNQASEKWSKSCRCGDANGYTVTEQELERESRLGEIYIGCHGCSLFIKVLFDVTEQEEDT